MDKHTAYNVLQSIHSRLITALTWADIKGQVGAEALKSAMLDLNRFIETEFKEESEARKDFMV